MGLSPRVCKRGVFSLMAELAQGARTLGGMLQMFLGELLHDQPRCGFYLHPRFLQLPIIRNAAELQTFLQGCPGVILHRPVRDSSLQTRIRVLLQRHDLEQMPDLEEISRQLLMAPRTLRRWLQDEGTSIRQIKEALRRNFALKLLGSEHLSVQEVAEQSGFAEAAAFCHAFKRWTGQSPAQWRKTQQPR